MPLDVFSSRFENHLRIRNEHDQCYGAPVALAPSPKRVLSTTKKETKNAYRAEVEKDVFTSIYLEYERHHHHQLDRMAKTGLSKTFSSDPHP